MAQTLDQNLTAFARAVAADSKAALNRAMTQTLANALAGTRLTCAWNGSAWTYNGQALTARPSARTDIYFDLIGAPTTAADPSWMLAGDRREDVA